MSRSFGNSSSNNLIRALSLISSTLPQPFSMCIRIRPNNTGIRQALYSNNDSGSTNLTITIEAANTIRVFLEGSDRAVSAAQTLNTGQWHAITASYHSDDSINLYLDGTEIATGSYTKVGTGKTSGSIIAGLTEAGTAGFDVDGELADFAFYNIGLIPEEHAAYAKGFSPKLISPGGLVSYVPLIGEGFSERDEINGDMWLKNGTLTKSDHPPVFMPSPAVIGIVVAAAVGAKRRYSLLLTGTG